MGSIPPRPFRSAAIPVSIAALICGALHAAAPASDDSAPTKGARTKAPPDPLRTPRFQLKLDADDRAAIERNLSYTLPEPSANLEWIGSPALNVDALRGRVLVIQSLSVKAANWRNSVDALRRQLRDFDADPPVVMLLQTPEGADRARGALEPVLDGWIGVIDSGGEWCDELGVWKRPVNLVVDRNGIARYAGLTPEGVKAAVEILRAEESDPGAPLRPRPPAESPAGVRFPVFDGPVGSAADLRGTPMPPFQVESWVNGQPDPGDRLIVIDFWATWCGSCRAVIPHLNDLATQFGADACFVGLSDETPSKFEEGCAKHKLRERDFRYALALDSQRRLFKHFAVRSIPHCVIASADRVVRWQGSPADLTPDVMRSLVEANRGLARSAKGSASASSNSRARGWKNAGGSSDADGGTRGGARGTSGGRGRRY